MALIILILYFTYYIIIIVLMFIAVYRIMVYVIAGAECSLWDTAGDNQRAFMEGKRRRTN